MLKLTVKGVADIGKLLGDRRGELTMALPPGSTLRDLLETMIGSSGPALGRRLFQADGRELRKDIRLLINGREIALLNGLETQLQKGDHLSIIPPLAGG